MLRSDDIELPVEHWTDGDHSGRDNVKFWAGATGYPGAPLDRDALAMVSQVGHNALEDARADPAIGSAPMSSSFRFDWRRDYIPLMKGYGRYVTFHRWPRLRCRVICSGTSCGGSIGCDALSRQWPERSKEARGIGVSG